jgi:hypothetical protein
MTGALLPRMTDPLGRHWGQPAGLRDRVRVYETHATIAEADWRKLSDYRTSLPSGVYAGKVWRRGPLLCWYGPIRGDSCRVGYLRALVQGPGTNATYRGQHE